MHSKYAPSTNDHEYRLYLQRNAEKIMQDLRPTTSATMKLCPVCKMSLEYNPNTPDSVNKL